MWLCKWRLSPSQNKPNNSVFCVCTHWLNESNQSRAPSNWNSPRAKICADDTSLTSVRATKCMTSHYYSTSHLMLLYLSGTIFLLLFVNTVMNRKLLLHHFLSHNNVPHFFTTSHENYKNLTWNIEPLALSINKYSVPQVLLVESFDWLKSRREGLGGVHWNQSFILLFF